MYQTSLKGGGVPPFGKRPNYFRFFLVKGSLRQNVIEKHLSSYHKISKIYKCLGNTDKLSILTNRCISIEAILFFITNTVFKIVIIELTSTYR